MRQKKDRFEEARLAGRIAAYDARSPLMELQRAVLNAAKVGDLDRAEHATPALTASWA